MKINVEKWIAKDAKHKRHDIVAYKILSKEFCCETIKHLPIDIKYTVPAFEDEPAYEEEDGYFTFGAMLEESYAWYDGEDTQTDERYYLVHYCPVCGEKIEINTVREIDKTEEYKTLKVQFKDIVDKWRNCDSMKKSAELDKQRRQLNKLIDVFHTTDSIKEREDD